MIGKTVVVQGFLGCEVMKKRSLGVVWGVYIPMLYGDYNKYSKPYKDLIIKQS